MFTFGNTKIARTLKQTFPLLLLTLFCWQKTFAQNELPFTYLTEAEGLANNLCYKVFTDKNGCVWVGTQNGLSRYLGNSFINYRPDPANPNAISGLIVKDILEDENGHLWLAVQGGGLNRFDPKTSHFTAFKHDPNDPKTLASNEVHTLLLDREGQLWVGALGGGLSLMDRKSGICTRFPLTTGVLNDENRLGVNSVFDILECDEDPGVLWLATGTGVSRFDKKTGSITPFPSSRPYTEFMSVHQMLQGQPGHLWLGSYGAGICLFRKSDGHWEYFPPLPEKWQAYSSRDNIILDFAPKSADELWIASLDRGLGIFNLKTKNYRFLPTLPRNAKFPSVNAISLDPAGRLWVCNHENGLAIHDPRAQQFHFSLIEGDQCVGSQYNRTLSFAEDARRGLLYTTTTGCNGFYIFEKNESGGWRFKQSARVEGFSENSIYSVEVDKNGRVWVGSDQVAWSGGSGQGVRPTFWEYHFEKNLLQPVPLPPGEAQELLRHRIPDMLVAEDGTLWLLANYYGLVRFDISKNQFTVYPLPGSKTGYQMPKIIADRQGNLWICTTENGVFRFTPSDAKFLHFNKLVSLKTHSLAQDRHGKIWVGTEGHGIQILDPSLPPDQPIVALGAREGLPFPKITHISEAPTPDGSTEIWVVTETGVCRFNEKTGRFERFDQADGLPDSYFYYKGFYVSPQGTLCVGQDGGFCYRNLLQPGPSQSKLPLVFSGFSVAGSDRFSNFSFEKNQTLSLQHDENFFTLRFAALDYTRPEKVRFSYRLEGVNNEWITTTDNRGEAVYTQIRPGSYTFRVRAADHSGRWSDEEISVRIRILPPWWASPAAYILYGVAVFAGLYFFWKTQLNRRLAQQEARRLRDLDELKTRLYANITHEFRTPLTLLLGPAERALRKFESTGREEIRSILETVRNNGQRLLNLVNQILDLRKIESTGGLDIFWEHGDVIQVLRQTVASFEPMAKMQNLRLQFSANPESLEMDFDRDKLLKISTNLLSNAVKFTPPGGQISIKCTAEGTEKPFLKIEVTDSGIGISPEDLPHVFERYFQAKNSSATGTGLGLALTKELAELLGGRVEAESRIGEGSVFRVWLPVRRIPIFSKNRNSISDSGQVFDFENEKLDSISTFEIEKTAAQADDFFEKTDTTQPQILIIEDNPEMARYIASCLPGYQIDFAENGRIGIEKAFERIPDLVVTDWMMPEKDGLEVCQTLKSDERTSHIPVILLTARVAVADRLEGLRRGADVYLSKPFVEEELQIQVSQLLASRKKLAERYAALPPIFAEKSEQLVENQSFDLRLEDTFFKKIMSEIETHFADPNFGVEQLCRAMLMSHTQLQRKLSATTEKTPLQIIRDYRLNQAKSLLRRSDLTVAEVSYRIGFDDPSYFTRVFSKAFGVTPTEFRGA